MGKIFGIVFIVAGLWIGMTIYTEGTDRAFGGIFASSSSSSPGDSEAASSPLERIEQRGAEARNAQLERIESQLDDSSVGLND
jgi:hypothetical protein